MVVYFWLSHSSGSALAKADDGLWLMLDGRVELSHKAYMGAALAYVISPIDLISERRFGVLGHLDDVVVGLAAVGLVVTRLLPGTATDVTAIQVSASMGGFEPPVMQAKAGSTVRVEFASTDTPFHSDGGGWHELAIEELGIDWKVAPQSRQVFEFTAPAEPGTYAFYCDICCGGKENPSMQGRLTVTA